MIASKVYILSTFSKSDNMSIKMVTSNVESALQICGSGYSMPTCMSIACFIVLKYSKLSSTIPYILLNPVRFKKTIDFLKMK